MITWIGLNTVYSNIKLTYCKPCFSTITMSITESLLLHWAKFSRWAEPLLLFDTIDDMAWRPSSWGLTKSPRRDFVKNVAAEEVSKTKKPYATKLIKVIIFKRISVRYPVIKNDFNQNYLLSFLKSAVILFSVLRNNQTAKSKLGQHWCVLQKFAR